MHFVTIVLVVMVEISFTSVLFICYTRSTIYIDIMVVMVMVIVANDILLDRNMIISPQKVNKQ